MPGGLHPPPEVLLSWPTPNYVNPPTRGWAIPITTIVLGSLALLAIILRLWSRISFTRNAGIDDWVLVVAMVPTMALTVCLTLSSQVFYFNRHVWDIPVSDLYKVRVVTFINEELYVLAVGLIKISVLLFYWRLTAGILPRSFAYVLWFCIGLVIAFMIVFLIFPFAQCQPFKAYFYQVDPHYYKTHEYHCISDLSNIYVASIISAIQDFLVALLPTAFFFRLDIPFRQKLASVSVFAIGFFLCVAGVVRLVYVWRIFNDTYDATWVAWDAWLWTNIEVVLGVIVASAPALKVFFKNILDGTYGSYETGEKRGDGTAGTYTGDTVTSGSKSRFSLRRLSKRFSFTPGDPGGDPQSPMQHDPNIPPPGFALPLRNLSEEHIEEVEEHGGGKSHEWPTRTTEWPSSRGGGWPASRNGELSPAENSMRAPSPQRQQRPGAPAPTRWNFPREPCRDEDDDDDLESQYTTATAAERAREVRDLGREVALGRIGRLHMDSEPAGVAWGAGVGRAM